MFESVTIKDYPYLFLVKSTLVFGAFDFFSNYCIQKCQIIFLHALIIQKV